jgi:hypothetical protein
MRGADHTAAAFWALDCLGWGLLLPPYLKAMHGAKPRCFVQRGSAVILGSITTRGCAMTKWIEGWHTAVTGAT